jgi:carboxymethylenebutenolidase
MKPVMRFISTFAPAMVVLCLLAQHAAEAREPRTGTRTLRLGRDSVLVHYAVPDSVGKRPAVLVLHDRFGLQTHVQSVLRVLATVGYRAFALPLNSAPLRPVEGMPPAVLDSSDISRVAQAAVELLNEEECTGKIGLLGFDVGAAVAAESIARLPFFKAAVLFYPSGGTTTLARLPFSPTPILLCIAYDDNECSINDVGVVREVFIDEGRRLEVQHYKDTKRFFFNPEHEQYNVPAMKAAWKEMIRFFNRRL